ncbi:MAG: hypothetical protein M3O70_00825 [Actinomycetota bacterium]|nr:hypothetical protein [Actinomycetota bacterium]
MFLSALKGNGCRAVEAALDLVIAAVPVRRVPVAHVRLVTSARVQGVDAVKEAVPVLGVVADLDALWPAGRVRRLELSLEAPRGSGNRESRHGS